jgi:hypothetical protein
MTSLGWVAELVGFMFNVIARLTQLLEGNLE